MPWTAIREFRKGRAKARALSLREHADQKVAACDDRAASEALARLLALRPDSLGALVRAARVEQRLGHAEAARSLWSRAAAVRPGLAEAHAEQARHALAAGDWPEARAQAQQALAGARDATPFGIPDAMARLLAHLEEHPDSGGDAPDAAAGLRHLAIGGVSYCGSTLLGYVLGGLPDVANVGESHWLVNRREGASTHAIDFDRDDASIRSRCNHCGPSCVVLDDGFRRDLARHSADWFQKIAARLDTRVLVSSDKNILKLRALDPGLRFDLLVLFKAPLASWSSTRRKPHVDTTLEQHLLDWHQTHASLLHDLPNRGRRLALHFDAFRRAPEPHLKRLCEILGLAFDARALRVGEGGPQHTFGGNPRAHRTVDAPGGEGREIQQEDDPLGLPAAERERVERFESASPILAELQAAHDRDFG